MKRNTDLYGGIFMILVSLLFFTKLKNLTIYSKIFPIAIIAILTILGIALILKSVMKPSLSEIFVLGNKKNVILVVLVTLAWVLLFKKIGFVVTSFLSLSILLCVLNNNRDIKAYMKTFIIAGCQIGILYLIFSKILYVPFPRGIFF
ncbi:MAG: tripartite tricarboxylate transporter TctB family protein [Tissierellia bacterium]|nr:tripartite tricarboxylate transporter TctB family protein [Tissierellia bacterium]MDD4726652.1 tripartite tricarboxylate transporter TctB family protein [Tissierellia bacterium]